MPLSLRTHRLLRLRLRNQARCTPESSISAASFFSRSSSPPRSRVVPVAISPHAQCISQMAAGSPSCQDGQPDIDSALGVPRRVYIVGTGSIGKLVAHSFASLTHPPPITLLFHKPSLLESFREAGRQIELITGGRSDAVRGFDAELAMPNRREHGREIEYDQDHMRTFDPGKGPPAQMTLDHTACPRGQGAHTSETISSLIVTTKASSTVSAISAIRHRLTPSSTICFLQNGMGIIDEVNKQLFPDVATRPNYMQGVISHGVHSSAPFSATHAGVGTVQVGLVPSSVPGAHVDTSTQSWALSSRYLLRTLTRSPALCAVALAPTDLLCAQLEKLAVNCLLNPLTALLDVRNGSLLHNFHLTRAMRLLLAEISLVIRSLPELRSTPNLDTRFAASRLETLAVSVAEKTGDNISSMLADTRRGLQTEIDYINGYIVNRGEEVGIKCVMNYMLLCLVNGKQNIVGREIDQDITLLTQNDTVAYSIGEGAGKRKT